MMNDYPQEVLKELVQRMIRNDRSLDFAERFVEQWLRTRELGTDKVPDAKLFPTYAMDEATTFGRVRIDIGHVGKARRQGGFAMHRDGVAHFAAARRPIRARRGGSLPDSASDRRRAGMAFGAQATPVRCSAGRGEGWQGRGAGRAQGRRAGGAGAARQGLVQGRLPGRLPDVRRRQEPHPVLVPRGGRDAAVRRPEEPKGRKGVGHAESETTRLQMPARQAPDAQENGRSGAQHLSAVQADEAPARRLPQLRNLQGPGSHRPGISIPAIPSYDENCR